MKKHIRGVLRLIVYGCPFREQHIDDDTLVRRRRQHQGGNAGVGPGIDVGSIEFVHQQLLDYRAAGKAILLISAELSEVMSLSDRILVMYEGEIVGELDAEAPDTTEERLGLLMAGATENASRMGQANTHDSQGGTDG